MTWFSINRFLIASLSALLLAGCGGSAGSDTPAAVTGVAAAGAPLVGTVSLKDSSLPAQERSAAISADGSFRIDLSGLQAPFLLRASSAARTLYSFASAGGVANINPLSSLAVTLANNGVDPFFPYALPSPAKLQYIGAALPQAVAGLQAALKPTLDKFGVGNVNFISGPFVANHQGLDLLLDLANININGSWITLEDKWAHTMVPVLLADLTSGSFDFIANPVTTSGTFSIAPAIVSINTGGTVQFSAYVIGSSERSFSWSMVEAGGGAITDSGLYTASTTAGSYHVRVTSLVDPTKSVTALVSVSSVSNAVSIISTTPGVYTVMADLVNVGGAEVEVAYDMASLANPTVIVGELNSKTMFIANSRFAPGLLKFTFMGLTGISGSGSLATITFDVLKSEPPLPFISRHKLVAVDQLATTSADTNSTPPVAPLPPTSSAPATAVPGVINIP